MRCAVGAAWTSAAFAVVLLCSAPAGLAGQRTVALVVDAAIERVGSDRIPPFTEAVEGEFVHYRVTVTSNGPATARRGELRLALLGNVPISVRGRQGWRCQSGKTAAGWAVLCHNALALAERSVSSVLVRVPARGDRVVIQAGVRPNPLVETDLRVQSNRDRQSILVLDAPWAGQWSWQATLRGSGRSFVSPSPIEIGQRGGVVCAIWSFSGGGIAEGAATQGSWTARWQDGYGSGSWTLSLAAGGASFTGVQTVRPRSGAAEETYDIVGSRQSLAGSLDCDDVTVPA